MARKLLGQAAPSATTNTDLYTVPGGKQATVSTLVICNRSTSGVTYRVALRPAGAAIANQHYIEYDADLAAKGTDYITIGIGLAATDVVTVYASTANLSFTLCGDES